MVDDEENAEPPADPEGRLEWLKESVRHVFWQIDDIKERHPEVSDWSELDAIRDHLTGSLMALDPPTPEEINDGCQAEGVRPVQEGEPGPA